MKIVFLKRFAILSGLFLLKFNAHKSFAQDTIRKTQDTIRKTQDTVKVQDTIRTQDTIRMISPNRGEIVITQPEFRGGMTAMRQYIDDNFVYPDDAARRSVNGKMEVEFTIEKSGDVSYVSILKGLDFSIDEEVLRLLKAMPRWIPATKNGAPVRYKVSMPITIRASRSKKSGTALQGIYDR